jgi:hypothetical protein
VCATDNVINGTVKIGSHKMQGGAGVQIKTTDGTYFNIGMAEIKKGEAYIVEKLR